MSKAPIRVGLDTREFKNFEKELQKLPNRVATRALQNSVSAAIRPGLKALKAAAPRGDEPSPASETYGPLYKNIRIGRKPKPKDKNQRSAYVHTGDSFWGFFLEYGTSKMAARPWWSQAFESAKTAMLAALDTNLTKRINAEWDKLGKKR